MPDEKQPAYAGQQIAPVVAAPSGGAAAAPGGAAKFVQDVSSLLQSNY